MHSDDNKVRRSLLAQHFLSQVICRVSRIKDSEKKGSLMPEAYIDAKYLQETAELLKHLKLHT